MDARCRIELLGPLRLMRGDESHTRFGGQKSAALLAYLALRPGPHGREQVLDVFWPEMDLPEGRNNLSTALSGLRRLLEPPGVRKGSVLVTTHAHVGLDPAAVTTDVADFERLLAQAGRAQGPDERVGLFCRALALYGGAFQPGNYADWAVQESERLEACRVATMDSLADDFEALGRYGEAVGMTQQRLAADPYAEASHLALVRRLARAGRREAAREAAQRFEAFLREEYGAGPDAQTQRLLEDVLAQAAPAPAAAPPPRPAVAPAPPESQATGTSPSPEARPEVRAALPFWLSRFFGREPELAQLAALLLPSKEPHSTERPARLVTLAGPGGAGKTRLAAEFARLAAERFGLWCGFVPLADLADPAQIPARIAEALRLTPSPQTTPLEQVVAFFATRQKPGIAPSLLVLDNLEQLLGQDDADTQTAEIVRALLSPATGLSILCTSRRRLGLSGERLLPLGPLPIPEGGDPADDLAALASVPSVRLYVDRAQAVRPDFGLTPTNAEAVAGLCRALEGSPLALELAASWVRQTPPRRMWERLRSGLDVPEGRQTDLPARHRSLSAALDWSWRLLPPAQQRLLARLSVFRGGWTLEAAEAACEEPDALGLLASLEEASLVTSREDADGDVRYGVLETVRQFAAQKVAESGEAAGARDRHLDWFAALARAADAEIRGPKQTSWLARLESENENLRTALDWAISGDGQAPPPPADLGLRMVPALGMFWLIRGYFQEAWTYVAAILARPDAQAPTKTRSDVLQLGALLRNEQGDLPAARSLHQAALDIDRTLGDGQRLAVALNNFAIVVYDQGDADAARATWKEALAVARETSAETVTASILANLGEMALEDGDLDAGRPLLEEALAGHRKGGSKFNVAYILKVLTTLTRQQGDLAASRRFLAEGLTIQQEIGHKVGIAQALEAAAALSLTSGCAEQCATLCGAAAGLREEIAAPLPANESARHEAAVTAARAALGDKAFGAAFRAGQGMNWDGAIAYAMAAG